MVNHNSRNVRVLATAVIGVMVAATVVVAAPLSAAATTGTSHEDDECGNYAQVNLRLSGAPVGTFALPGVPGGTVTVSNVRSSGKVFDWTSNSGIDLVVVEGVTGEKNYSYTDGRSGVGLTTPTVLGVTSKVSEIHFCSDGREAPTTSADTTSVKGARGVAISDIPLASLPASLINQVAGADLVNDAGTGLRFSGTSLRFSGTGLRYSGTGLRYSGTGLRYSGTSLRFSGTGLRFSGTGLRFSGTGLRFSGNGIGTLVNVRSAGTGLRFSGTGLRFSGTGLRFSALPAWDVPLSELQPPQGYSWDDVFVAVGKYQGFPPQNVTLGQLLDALNKEFASPAPAAIVALGSMSLLDLDPTGNVLRNVSLVGLLLGNTKLVNIPLPAGSNWCTVIDPEFTGTCNTSDIGDATVLALNLAGLRSDNLPLASIPLNGVTLDPDSVLADLLANSGVAGDLYVPAVAGDTLASYLVRGIDALNVPWEQLPLTAGFDVRQYALGTPVNFTSNWTQIGAGSTDVVATPPAGFVLAQGSPTCTTSAGTCTVTQTVVSPPTFRVQTAGSTAFQNVALKLMYRPKGLLGTASAPTGGSFSIKAGVAAAKSFAVGVTDPWAGQSPPPVEPDVLYFGKAASGAIDNYDVDVSKYGAGSHVAVRLSNLSNDADLVLYRSAGTGLRFSGTGMRFSGTGLRYSGTGLRYSGGSGDESVTTKESETLEDVPINQSLLVEDVSATRSNTPEAVEGFTSLDTTKFRVQVSGFNKASTDYAMRVAVTQFGDACPQAAPATANVTFSGTAGADTIVVYPRARFTAAEQATIDGALSNLAGFWPYQLATVATSGADWTTQQGSCSVSAANAVAESVSSALQQRAATAAGVKHVMLIGGDDKLPMYRSPDTTLIANEANYASTVGGQNPLTSALTGQNFLTDDIYGDSDPWPFLNRLYFTPDRAVGRLVESANDIAGQINGFVSSGGKIAANRAFTAGYDFLADAAVKIDSNLNDVTANRSTLISDVPGGPPDWTAAQLTDGLKAGDNGASLKLASINAHMDQGLLLSAAGDAQGANPAASEVVKPDVVIPSGVRGAVMFTAGCHAGFNQPYTNATRTDSWAKSLAGGAAAVYLANTGYGYGLDQPIIGYSEELLTSFSDLLELNGSTVGQAAAYAKQKYFSGQIEIDPYDEKSQMQLTLYGVPMYSLSGVAVTPPPVTSVVQQTTIDPLTNLNTASIGASVTFAAKPGANGTGYYAVDQAALTSGGVNSVGSPALEAADGKPIQPKFTADVTAPAGSGLIARGAIIESLSSSEANLDNPTIARAVVDNAATEKPNQSGTLIFPTAFATVQTEQTPTGPRGKLVVVPGQFNSGDANEQLLIDSFNVRAYYASPDSPDVVRPQFSDVSASGVPSASGSGTDLLLRASVSDPNDPTRNVFGTGVQRVLIQYFDGRTWFPVEMFPANAARTEWSGGLAGINAGGVFFVQAVDGAGNVSATANKGQNYVSGGQAADAVAFVTGPQGSNGWYLGSASVELKGAAVGTGTHTVAVNGGTPVTYTGPLTLDAQGSNTVDFNGPGANPIRVIVPVDTQAPVVDLATPIAVLAPGDTVGPTALAACSDPQPGSGLRDLDPTSASNCLVTTNQYTLALSDGSSVGPFTLASARGEDYAGNAKTESQSAVILSGTAGTGGFYTTPVILGVLGAASLQATIKIGDAPAVPYSAPIKIDNSAGVVVTVGNDVFQFPVKVDKTAPNASAVVPAGPFKIGDVVTVPCSFLEEAGGSGLASVKCGSVLGTDQTSLSLTLDTSKLVVDQDIVVSAADKAGNVTTQTYMYSVTDQDPPTASAVLPPGPYDLGQTVIVSCTFGDTGGSGLASVKCGDTTGTNETSLSNSLVVTKLGVDQEFVVSATDGARNVTKQTYKYTASDRTPPTATVTLPDGPYQQNQVVSVTCNFADAGGSSLATVRCGSKTGTNESSLTVNVDTSTLGLDQKFVVSATDGAGNGTSEELKYSVTDQIKPTATVVLPAGPYQKDQVVPVTCTFTDAGGSGLKSVTCGGTPVDATGNQASLTVNVNTSTLGVDQQFVVSATDGAGNATTQTPTPKYSVTDQTKPTASVAPVPSGSYQRGQVVSLTCTFADTGGSHLASVTCGGAPVGATVEDQKSLTVNLDTSTTGTKTFVVSATDNAGNVSTPTSYQYTVVDPLCDPQGDSPQAKGDIIRCKSTLNADGTATISISVAGTISNDGTQYRLRLATSATSSGTQVKWSAGQITGSPLKSAKINATDPSRLDFVIDLAKVGCGRGTKLYWSAQTQNGTKDPGVGFLDNAPNSGYFILQT